MSDDVPLLETHYVCLNRTLNLRYSLPFRHRSQSDCIIIHHARNPFYHQKDSAFIK